MDIAQGMREGAFLGSGLAISTTGVEAARERGQKARKDALTVVTTEGMHAVREPIPPGKLVLVLRMELPGDKRPERNSWQLHS